MTRPTYRLLRSYLTREGIDQRYLCQLMGKSQTYISNRFACRQGWSVDDMYWFMDELKIPYEDMHIVFPKNGLKIS